MQTDVFHFIAEHYKQNQVLLADRYAKMDKAITEEFLIDGDTYWVSTGPVVEHDGGRLGVVVEWKNVTHDIIERLAKEKELQQQTELAQRNARIKQALDNVSTQVMVADANHSIIYINHAMQAMFETFLEQFKTDLPQFSHSQIVGTSVNQFQTQRNTQSQIFAFTDVGDKALVEFGRLRLSVTSNPVFDGQKRIGTVYEWIDRTEELASEAEVQKLVSAAVAGDLTVRIDLDNKTGFYKTLSEGLNRVMDTVSNSIEEISLSLMVWQKEA